MSSDKLRFHCNRYCISETLYYSFEKFISKLLAVHMSSLEDNNQSYFVTFSQKIPYLFDSSFIIVFGYEWRKPNLFKFAGLGIFFFLFQFFLLFVSELSQHNNFNNGRFGCRSYFNKIKLFFLGFFQSLVNF